MLDVLCAGEATWDLFTPPGERFEDAGELRWTIGGGAVNTALVLARRGLRVGLSATVGDDPLGAAFLARLAREGIETGDMETARRPTDVVFLESLAPSERRIASRREPARYGRLGAAARAVVISGVVPDAAAMSEIGAALTRRGPALVVIDINARRRLWRGASDASAVLPLLRAVDVVKASAEDLEVSGIDAADVGTLVVTRGTDGAEARGEFGSVHIAARKISVLNTSGAGDAFTAGMVEALLELPGRDRESWRDVLERASERACEWLSRATRA